ncbi:biopolymer transporter ExbD [Pontiellaceae bacterium B12219]|nr:biopolymer transporter ExbD [Pontiellaceae bacterium B12219]
MRRNKNRRFANTNDEIELSMTPMIDVVFQLLIYFLVTFSTADVLALLDISRPAPDAAQSQQTPPADMIRVAVLKEGFAINGRAVSVEELDALLKKLAQISTKQTVMVNCDDQSLHGKLIQALDMCASHGLTQIAVMSGK